jgi:hypothetical protein
MRFIYFFIILFIFYITNNILNYKFNYKLNKEHFVIKTWTPYIIDKEYQPGYSNYFYNNGYMYPIY